MIVALVDNGSLEAAAHRNLRKVAGAISAATAAQVHAVSWKHSDRVPQGELDDTPAWTLAPFVRSLFALGQREFVFVPFFISAQGAIGSALQGDIETLRRELGHFDYRFTEGLATRGVLGEIVAHRTRDAIARHELVRPLAVVVDHGGPSATSAAVRDELAATLRELLGSDVASVTPASMEGAHGPLLADCLADPDFADRDVVVAPLFLSPGRHAGPDGDIARICRTARSRCHLADLVGTHPIAAEALAAALRHTLSNLHVSSLA